MVMTLREFLSHPISSIRQWAASHERFIAVAAVFFIVSIIFLLKSLGIL